MERFHQARLPVRAATRGPPQASARGPALPVTRAVRAEAGGSQGREATDGFLSQGFSKAVGSHLYFLCGSTPTGPT